MNDFIKKNRNFELVHLVTLLTGGVSLLGSFLLPPGLKEILYSLGTAFLASSFIGFFNKRYLSDEKAETLYKEWGLRNIYEFRVQKNAKTNERIKNGAKRLDCIIQGGLDGLRNKVDVNLIEKISGGLIIRLLIPKDDASPEIGKANKELEDWYYKLSDKQKSNITIRKYNGSPQELYFRLDEMVFVGPYFVNLDSSRNITYEFDLHYSSKGGELYAEHFEDLWENSKDGEIR
jgi:hypothetical protein